MDLDIIRQSEVGQTEKEKHHMMSSMWKQKKRYKWTYLQKKPDSQTWKTNMLTKGNGREIDW